jgi:hypothetical protein
MSCGPNCGPNCKCGANCMCGPGCQCGCNSRPGLGSYGVIPPRAEHGFRFSIPGGPPGGQFHGRTDANPLDEHWRGGIAHNTSGARHGVARVRPHSGHGSWGWGGSPHQDPFHRGAGELVPRPNASGDLNIVGAPHMPAVPGYAMVPGGLFPTSRLGSLSAVKATPHSGSMNPVPVVNNPISEPLVPLNGSVCGGPDNVCMYGPSGGNIARIPPPSGTMAPAPITQGPIPVMLSPQPSPVVSAPTTGTPSAGQPGCVTGQYDANGNCIISSTVPGMTSTGDWFTDPTQDLIAGLPNWALTLGVGGAFLLLMQSMKKK